MEYVFITPTGILQDSWRDVFPDAVAVSRASEVPEAPAAHCGVLWIDAGACVGRAGVRELRNAVALGQPVVVLTDSLDEAEALKVLNAGAVGYCLSTTAPGQFREIALVVEHGGLWIAPEMKQPVLALASSPDVRSCRSGRELDELTSREMMVAEQVARGATNREIAHLLAITERTVKAHLSAVFEKLSVRDRVQLALTMNDLPTYSIVS